MTRLMALDYGDKTVGVAVSDETGTIAGGLETIRRESPEAINVSVARIKELVKHYNIKEIVLGLPKKMNNTEGERCAAVRRFKEKLERNVKNIPVILWDERLSTKSALSAMPKGADYLKTDMMAAAYFLQSYMDYKAGCESMSVFDGDDSITLLGDDGEEVRYKVMDKKERGGINYLLVFEESAKDDDDSDAYIIKAVDTDGEDEIYEFLEDGEEFDAVAGLFQDNDDYDIEY